MASKFVAAALAVRAASALDFTACPDVNQQLRSILVPQGTPFAPFDCANVSVPLDYTDDNSESLDINVFRVNATEQPALGNLLINFGGPGGAGAENLPAWASQMAYIVGPRWNLISWDPRGTGYTIPYNCTVAGGLAPSTNTKRELGSLVSTNTTEGFLEWGWDMAGQTAEACAAQNEETGALIGTAFVARDVMKIVDAMEDGGDLNYYGWSYGTALGSYLAAMFPDRIGRMVLDANVNPHDYQSGTYADLADDVDEAFDGWLQTCFDAKDDCSLYTLAKPNSTAELLATLNAALALYETSALNTSTTYLTWVGLKNQIYQPLYFPRQWPLLADLLTLALNGKTPSAPPESDSYGDAVNAVYGIRASDATFQANSSSEYLPIVRQEAKVSKSFSDTAYVPLWVSARWTMPAKERYWGDFQEDTKNPILYVNGEYDPVTPIVGAYNGSAGFTGSVVLAHSGYGHGLLADPSRCASRHVQQYLQDGTLPPNGTTCEPDQSTLEIWQASVQASNTSANGTSTSDGGPSGTSSPNGSSGQPSSSASAAAGEGAGNSMASGAFFSAAISGAVLLGSLVMNL